MNLQFFTRFRICIEQKKEERKASVASYLLRNDALKNKSNMFTKDVQILMPNTCSRRMSCSLEAGILEKCVEVTQEQMGGWQDREQADRQGERMRESECRRIAGWKVGRQDVGIKELEVGIENCRKQAAWLGDWYGG